MINPIAKNVLDYWFGSRPITPADASRLGKIWFGGDKDVDYDIERRFGKLVSAARAGSFDGWRSDAENCLALIILLDQFPRNLFRGQAAAFASDEQAFHLSRDMIKQGLLTQLDYPERAFALMPFQHVESKNTSGKVSSCFSSRRILRPKAGKNDARLCRFCRPALPDC